MCDFSNVGDPCHDDVILTIDISGGAVPQAKFIVSDEANEHLNIVRNDGLPVVTVFANGDVGVWDSGDEIRYIHGPSFEQEQITPGDISNAVRNLERILTS